MLSRCKGERFSSKHSRVECSRQDFELRHDVAVDHVAAIGDRGNIYVAGGYSRRYSHCVTKVRCYSLSSDQWRDVEDFETGRDQCSLAVCNSNLYVSGGRTESWTPSRAVEYIPLNGGCCMSLPAPKEKESEIAVLNGNLVVTGGFEESSVVQVYDRRSNAWLPQPSLKRGRHKHGVLTTDKNELLVIGGFGAEESVERFLITQ